MFTEHTIESAPAASRRFMEATARPRGYVPAAVARLASSPHLLEGFLKLSGLFEATTLDAVAREVVILTMATRNRCQVCVAMHTAKLIQLGAPADVIDALRAAEALPDPGLEAVRLFTLAVLADAGRVEDEALQAFLAQGFTPQNALEVVLGIGTYTMSTLANRLTDAPLDPALEPYAWVSPAA